MREAISEKSKEKQKVDRRHAVLALFPENAVGAEVGVFRGDFSRRIVDVCKPKKLFLVDPWQNFDEPSLSKAWYAKGSPNDMDAIRAGVESGFAEEIARGQVQICHGMSGDILGGFADHSLDYIYIDGDHRYEGVASDLAHAMRVVKPGGVIAADDYTLGGWWKDGVVRAVNEFLGANAAKLRAVHVLGGQFVMRKTRPAAGEVEGS